MIVLCPVPGLVLRRCPAAHISLLLHWIHTLNPTEYDLCDKAASHRRWCVFDRRNTGLARCPARRRDDPILPNPEHCTCRASSGRVDLTDSQSRRDLWSLERAAVFAFLGA